MGGWGGGTAVKRGENTGETINKKCKHGGQNADKRHKTLQLPVLNSPLSFSLRTVLWNPWTALGYQATRILSKVCQRDRERIPCMIKVAHLIAIISQDVYV